MRLVAGVVAALCLVLSAAAEAAPLSQAACSAWGQRGTLVLKGSSDADGFSGTYAATVDVRSGRAVAVRDYGAYARTDGFDGRFDWARDRSGASHALDASAARAIAVTNAWLRRRGWCAGGARHDRIAALADGTEDGTSLAVWQVTPKGGIPVILRFDRATGLLRQSEIGLWEGRLIRHYSDWRDIGGGALVPFAERDENPEDQSVEIIKLTDAALRPVRMPAATFAMPSRATDYEILGGGPSTTVPYEDDGVGRIYVPVSINGQGPYPFEVDTGGHFILSTATAAALHLDPVGKANVTGGGTGIMQQGSVRTDEVRIGDAVIHAQPAWVIPFSAASNDRGPHPPRAGFLGLELFERFAVALDRKARTLTLTPLENFHPPSGGVVVPLRFIEDAPLARGSFAGIAGDFEIDSGDAGPAIVEGYWAERHGLARRLAAGIAWSGGGVGGDFRETISRGDFTLGPVALPHEVTSYVGLVERGSESTRLQAGLIGESTLYRFDMAYDYRRRELWIDPAPAVPPRPFNRAGLRLRKDVPDRLSVVLVVPGSAADVAGIKLDDQILAIDGRPAATLGVADALTAFSGAIGTDVALSIVPKSGGAPQPVTLRLKELLP